MFTHSGTISEIKPISADDFIKKEMHERDINAHYLKGLESYEILKGAADIAIPLTENSKDLLLISFYFETENFAFKMTTALGNYTATDRIIISKKLSKTIRIMIPVAEIPPGIGVQIKTLGDETQLFVNPYSPSYPAKPF